ncbi:MAG: Xaa-Pro peptidase family protein [Alphaproteobacteria bacterium]
MALHFSTDEFAGRVDRTTAALAEADLDGLLIFRQESMYYLTGYDTFGFVHFQCLYLGVDGTMTLLTRAPDLRQAQHTSTIENIRIWTDRAGATPADDLKALLDDHGCRDKKLGVELEAYGLTGAKWCMVEAAMEGFCSLSDASNLINALRVIKSPAELDCIRRAAALGDAALDEANRLSVAGAYEGDILAAMQGAVFSGGGDYPGNEFIIGSGRDALLCRYFSGRRHLDEQDQLMLEFAGVYHHYHAALMRTIVIGEPDDRHRPMHDACIEALAASKDALKPGRLVGDVFDAHAQTFDSAGFSAHRMNACGYSMGSTFSPNWMDWPMFYADNPIVIVPGMTFFLHMILMDSDHDVAMAVGESVLVGEDGCERLSRASLDLVVN